MIIRQKIFDTYWKFAAERQEIFFKKLRGESTPYSTDEIFNNYKFCNAYRASDRVSQFLIKEVIYKKIFNKLDTLFRIFLFRLINKNESWKNLEKKVGEISLNNFSFKKYEKAIKEIIQENGVFYGNAFILCANKAYGYDQKYKNHLSLLEEVFIKSNKGLDLIKSKSLKELFEKLLKIPLIGKFMAYQIAIDFNYSEVFNFSENDFVCAGPGAIRGINKCFKDIGNRSYEEIIFWMVKNQDKEFKRLKINFKNLFGRKLKAIDCQNLFCETDKYCRVKFPKLKSNRSKIKSIYKANKEKIEYFYPPKWRINTEMKF
ncbi:MAG: nucleotide kinase domain-containing protein [Candidatus Shapirobacteria bacterium]